MSQVETLYNMGDDALQNQFKVIIETPTGISASDQIELRVTQIDIPETTMGTYEVDYRSRKINKPSGKIETATEMTFTFRVDKAYTTYIELQRWLNRVGNNATGALGADSGGNIRGRITVTSLNPQTDVPVVSWIFNNAFIKAMPSISFDHSTGEAITVQPSFGFTHMTGSALTV